MNRQIKVSDSLTDSASFAGATIIEVIDYIHTARIQIAQHELVSLLDGVFSRQ